MAHESYSSPSRSSSSSSSTVRVQLTTQTEDRSITRSGLPYDSDVESLLALKHFQPSVKRQTSISITEESICLPISSDDEHHDRNHSTRILASIPT
ncbi:unnamed protein product [Adineta ricciae]|uniref:Uncharacterized protein n=1 Tax=Adineta ricciae TaxID=249248 RepID=A0A815ZI55_ADIRI|nr:unnamed protein product [Adineta ricciae]